MDENHAEDLQPQEPISEIEVESAPAESAAQTESAAQPESEAPAEPEAPAAPAGLPWRLNAAQARVLGALVEKEVTTPDYYPLSLNALINACNQRSNREPVTDLDEEEVRLALRGLEDKKLGGRALGTDSRVTKYEHHLGEYFNFTRAETALICVLLLRGPQTPGELRGRTERLHRFEELSDVTAGLQKLMERTPPLAAVLPRQPGTKEARYAHLLSGPVAAAAPAPYAAAYSAATVYTAVSASQGAVDAGAEARIAQLEAAVAELRAQFTALNQKFDDLFA
jgi:hypothetical protein